MCAVKCDAIETEFLRVPGGARIGIDNILYIVVRHRLSRGEGTLTRCLGYGDGPVRWAPDSGRSHGCPRQIGGVFDVPHDALMPELRKNNAPYSVHGLHHLAPTLEGLFTVHQWNTRVIDCRRMCNPDTFSDDKAEAGRCTTCIVRGNIIRGGTARTRVASHRRHDEAVGQPARTHSKRRQ